MALQSVKASIDVEAIVSGVGAWDEDSRGVFFAYEPKDWGDFSIDIAGVTVNLEELSDAVKSAIWDCIMDNVCESKWETQE